MKRSDPDDDSADGRGADGGARVNGDSPHAVAVHPCERFGGWLVDIEEVARWLGTSPRHVRRLVHERRMPYVKIGHYIRFAPADVTAWLELQRVSVADEEPGGGDPPWLRSPVRPVREGEKLSPSVRRRSTPAPVNPEPPWLRVRKG